MATTLVIRLSSLGDVAILLPVLYSVATKNPDDKFLLITKKPLYPLFVNKPDNLEIFPVLTKGKHKGIIGLWSGIGDIKNVIKSFADGASAGTTLNIADLHAVIRSGVIDFYFRLRGAKIALIDKGRKEKAALTRENHKKLQPLQTSLARYQQVFADLGYDASLSFTSLFSGKKEKEETWIGIAPFAKHVGKTYPLEQMETVVCLLSERPGTKIFLFGGEEEQAILETWTKKYAHLESVAGRMPFPDELALMNQLDVMLSMDSANMHLASLVNTPVVSVWGATHPYAGFYGFNQCPENALQTDLPCRPCSVYGNKSCYRGDYACLYQITPEMILHQIEANLR
ncbi:MAG: glycosyltransferase family 9 protein [Dysgonamonadaceae bacterium]|jgi:ADP-heptose:LPS heptosyltransferase|nr:glycosyltransferase family 9 protein [Dysgonamonadaceae bacterium]